MNTKLVYTGLHPLRALKQDWVTGMEISLSDLFLVLFKSSEVTETRIEEFKSKFLSSLGSDFILSSESSKGSVMVETGKISVSNDVDSAIERLKQMKVEEVVGTVQKEKHEMRTNLERKTVIAHLPEPGTTVMTGDSFQPEAVILGEDGAAVAVKSRSEEQRLIDNQLSDVSRNVIVHMPKNTVISPTKTSQSEEVVAPVEAKIAVEEVTTKKRGRPRKSFSAEPTAAEPMRITLDMIVNTDKTDAVNYINQCKDATVLKGARIRFNNVGDHQMITLIDRRLRVVKH